MLIETSRVGINLALIRETKQKLQSSTAATSLSARGVRRDGSYILDPADLHAGSGQSAKSGLGSRAWSAGAYTSRGAETDMKSVNAWEENELWQIDD